MQPLCVKCGETAQLRARFDIICIWQMTHLFEIACPGHGRILDDSSSARRLREIGIVGTWSSTGRNTGPIVWKSEFSGKPCSDSIESGYLFATSLLTKGNTSLPGNMGSTTPSNCDLESTFVTITGHSKSLVLTVLVLAIQNLSICLQAEAALVTDPTGSWNAITYSGPNQTDYLDDQQTGNATSSSDIVGDASNPAFFMQFDNGGDNTSLTDGTLFFRARMGAPGGSSTPVFDRNLFIGIDGDGDGGLDLYLGVHHQGSNQELAIYGPGANTNTSPSTTSITGPVATITEVDGVNYDYSIVDTASTDLDADGQTDYYVSFAYDFQLIVDAMLAQAGLTIDQNTTFNYVMATATQDNSFNQDLNGAPKNFAVGSTWATLGAVSDPILASGMSATPEPGSLALMGLASLLGVGVSRRRRRVTC